MADESVNKKTTRTRRKKEETASAASFSVKTQEEKKLSTVTVAYNNPRSIIFEVIDNSGVEHHVKINGNAVELVGKDKGILPLAGAYGLTPNVDAEIWEAIKNKYGKMPCFKNGLIFATTPSESGSAVADHAGTKNGFEPIDPNRSNTAPSNKNE